MRLCARVIFKSQEPRVKNQGASYTSEEPPYSKQTTKNYCYLNKRVTPYHIHPIQILPDMKTSLLSDIQRYLSSMPVDKAWIFGSFARGEETDNSDLDILVQFTEGVKIGLKYFHYINDLETLSNRKIDLVELSTLDPYVLPYVNQDKVLIYERTA